MVPKSSDEIEATFGASEEGSGMGSARMTTVKGGRQQNSIKDNKTASKTTEEHQRQQKSIKDKNILNIFLPSQMQP